MWELERVRELGRMNDRGIEKVRDLVRVQELGRELVSMKVREMGEKEGEKARVGEREEEREG